ncbi:MAG: M23/M56 family metallopeptidase [Bacteroidota bacterium]
MTLYLVYSSIAITVFWLYYILTLRRTTFFRTKRWFFLIAILFALILPFTHHFLEKDNLVAIINNVSSTTSNNVTIINSVNELGVELHSLENQLPESGNWLVIAYFLGCGLLIVRSIYAALAVNHMSKGAEILQDNDIKVFMSNGIRQPFSFFGKMYLPTEHYGDIAREVILHEREHITARHHIDLIVTQIISILLWFNPVVYIFKNAVRLNLEYLADKAVIDQGADTLRYQSLLIDHALENKFNNPLTTNFTLPLKHRITMMKKKRSNSWRQLALIGVIPLAGILMAMNTKVSLKEAIVENVPSLNFSWQKTDDKPSISPIKESDLTRLLVSFGKKFHPVKKVEQMHTGVDFMAKINAPVYATADGVIEFADSDEIKGNYIIIKHSDRYQTQYFHMNRLAVSAGDIIKKGAIIGYVGSTGKATGTHLHYEVLLHGKAVDPIDYFDAC